MRIFPFLQVMLLSGCSAMCLEHCPSADPLIPNRAEVQSVSAYYRSPLQDPEYALEQAVFYEKCKLTEVLLDLGADPNRLNDQGRMALHTAIELFDDSPEISMQLVELLLLRGADIEARGFPDFTALHRACAVNSIPIALMLIDRGASLVAAAEAWVDGGRTPLDVANTHRFDELASFLKSKGAKSVDDLPEP